MDATQIGFLILIYTSAAVILLVGVFLVRLLIELSGLVGSAKTVVDTVQRELEPTLEEFGAALKSLNSILNFVNEKVARFKKGCNSAANITKNIRSKMGGLFSGLVRGFFAGFRSFRK